MIAGRGLHRGLSAEVRFVARPGPVTLRVGAIEVPLTELAAVAEPGRRSTSVESADGRLRVDSVEHLFAALGAAGVREGIRIEVTGDELPLADGGAAAYFDALTRLSLPAAPPDLVVARDAAFTSGGSRYVFEVAKARSSVAVEVTVDFDDARLAREASWNGDPGDFRRRIAPARTFVFARDLEAIAAAGLGAHATPSSVVVLGEDVVFATGASFSADEPARHKLLDLVGDLYAHGGPPAGGVRALRPGHAVTHEVMRRALREGVVARQARVVTAL